MTNPHGSFIWYELMSPDPAGSKVFYDAVVGWDIEPEPAGEMDYRMIRRADGGNSGGVMRLTDEMRGHGARPMWLGYVGVDDVDRAVTAVEQRGGSVLMPAHDMPGVGRFAMVTDPGHIPFYVIKPTPPPGAEGQASDVFSPDQPQRVGWNELSSRDPDGAVHFYGQLFGWVNKENMAMGEAGDYRFLDHHHLRIGALRGVTPGGSAGWRYYVRVPSIAAAIEAVKAGGGSVDVGPHEVPGGDHIISGIDPQGARFALVGGQ